MSVILGAPPDGLSHTSMIKNASELLTSFIAAERKKVDLVNMPHMPTLGSAYEEIANAGIEKEFALPPNLGLRVVSGFIKGIPNQIDGMLVRGRGERYGLTAQYVYPIEQVLCVLEVKKTLNKQGLIDGIQHLAAVQRLFLESFSTRFDSREKLDFDLARESYEKLTGIASPRSDSALDALPPSRKMLYGVLARQFYAPVTVLLGFDGYKREHGLREALLDIIESSAGQASNASPDLLPSLITAGSFSVVKCTGRPYLLKGIDGEWVLLASARHNVARILLEFLWTKISAFCNVRMPFGLDMDHENLTELLFARGISQGDKSGFELRPFSYSETTLERPATTVSEPVRVSAAAIEVADLLGLKGGCLELVASLEKYIHGVHGTSLSDAVAELVRTSAFSVGQNVLQMVSTQATIASLSDGGGYVDLDGDRLTAWCENHGYKPIYSIILKID